MLLWSKIVIIVTPSSYHYKVTFDGIQILRNTVKSEWKSFGKVGLHSYCYILLTFIMKCELDKVSEM